MARARCEIVEPPVVDVVVVVACGIKAADAGERGRSSDACAGREADFEGVGVGVDVI